VAETFTVVTQYPTLEFIGGTQTQDVMAIGYRTKAHGVYFEVRIPRKGYTPGNVNSTGIGYTGTIEAAFANDNVIGGEWTQTPTAAGDLVDNIVYTVASDSGNSTAQLVVPYSQLSPGLYDPKLAALAKTLNDSEGL
jgi:hypothetical protein